MVRTFRTASVTRKASKLKLTDVELFKAIEQVRSGQAVVLGGGVYKKRIKTNELRSLLLAKGGKPCFYQYLFVKNEKENIEPFELDNLRTLAKVFGRLHGKEIQNLIDSRKLTEICTHEQ